MDLFITPGFSRRIIGTERFLDSQPITPADALTLLRKQPYSVILSHSEHQMILDFILACAG